MKGEVSLIIGGDLVPTESNEQIFEDGMINKLLCEGLKNELINADIRILNLETPLYDGNTPIKKCGPCLKASTKTIKGIKELNPTYLNLGNNHILDYGVKGLNSTKTLLEEYKINYVGVGNNVIEAKEMKIIKKNNWKIGIYSCAENEFSIATEDKAGANPIDLLETPDQIMDMKKKCDYLIVLYHGGKELYQYPTPDLQKICRKLVSKGADLIVCQHSHCVGAEENYLDGKIIYGQGNFIFDRTNHKLCNESILVQVNLGERINVNYIPIEKVGNGIRLSLNEKILLDFQKRSEEIKDKKLVETMWSKYCAINSNYYLCSLSGFNRYAFFINRLTGGRLIKKVYSGERLLRIINHMKCETHKELLDTIIIDKLERDK